MRFRQLPFLGSTARWSLRGHRATVVA